MKRISGSQVTVPVPCVSMALTLEGSNCASVSAIKITAWMGIFSLFLGDVRDDNEGILKGSWRTKKWKLQHIKKIQMLQSLESENCEMRCSYH